MAAPNPPSDNVFVGDLPQQVTKEDCETIFSAYGTVVQCRTLPPRQPGGKASALVRFGSVEEATWVVENLNGNLAEGLEEPLIVRFANAPGASPGKGGGKDAGYSPVRTHQWPAHYDPYGKASHHHQDGGKGGPPASDNLFIGNLPEHITTQDCEQIFAQYGSVVQAKAMPPKGPGQKASALVRFKSLEEATWVVENLNGNLAEGLEEPLIVRYANAPGGGKGSPMAGPPHGKSPWSTPQHTPWAAPHKGKGKGGTTMRDVFSAAKGAGLLGGKGGVAQENTIYVANLPHDTTDLDLFKLFAPFGAIPATGVKAMLNPDGTCKGFGFVDFTETACANMAVQTLHGFTCPDGTQLHCSVKSASKKGVGK